VEDARNVLSVGDAVEPKIVGVDRKSRLINLSVKYKDQVEAPRRDAPMPPTQEDESNGPTTLGDLIKQQLGQEI
ncbi:30S ribosomal protein S1, partial [Cobetia marina]